MILAELLTEKNLTDMFQKKRYELQKEKKLSCRTDLLLALQDRRKKKQRSHCSSIDTDTLKYSQL